MGINQVKVRDTRQKNLPIHHNSLYPAQGMRLLAMFLILAAISAQAVALQASDYAAVERLIGNRDAIIVSDHEGRILLSHNADQLRIPASTLKILTSLTALHYLGTEFRYFTDFYQDDRGNLIIKGYGDPLLISEVLEAIAVRLKPRLADVRDIILDDSYFTQPLTIPGVSSSSEPYDAPNGALCVNFNTVFFKKVAGRYASAESQTPLVPFALKRVKASGLDEGRVVLANEGNECTLYAGHLFKYFLMKQGIEINGRIRLGKVDKNQDALIYRHVSSYSLEDIVAKLLEHSNNFTTNQMLITTGVKVFGSPGTLTKGVRAMQQYAEQHLQLEKIQLTEGSGISRKNKMTAGDMNKVLNAFYPYRYLMRHQGREYYKTGTLRGISTRAGYIETNGQNFYRYTIFINSPGKSARKITRLLIKQLD